MEISKCYFQCVCGRVADVETDMQTEDLISTKDDVQKTIFVCFVSWLWTLDAMLLLCSSHLYLDISVMRVPNLADVCACIWSTCVSVSCFNHVPATNLCLFSVEPVNVHGFLSIFHSASTV